MQTRDLGPRSGSKRPHWFDTVEKVRVAATYGICVPWRSEKTPQVNPDSMQGVRVERDSIIGGDFAVRRTLQHNRSVHVDAWGAPERPLLTFQASKPQVRSRPNNRTAAASRWRAFC